jgi:dienelactone hydrolase
MLGIEEGQAPAGPAKVEAVATGKGCRVERVSLPLTNGTTARGLVIAPTSPGRHPAMIVCPDADTWPERFACLTEGDPALWLSGLVGRGSLVYVPQSIERLADHPYCAVTKGKDRRMVLYRLGYPVGRTVPGLDVQETLSAVEYLSRREDTDPARIGLAGIGQGGMTALYAAALDRRVRAAVVADYFERRNNCWQEPVDRRLPGQLLVCGDAELTSLVAPRRLGVVACPGHRTAEEVDRARRFYRGLNVPAALELACDVAPSTMAARAVSLLATGIQLAASGTEVMLPARCVSSVQAEAWRNRHFEERLQYLRKLIADSEAKRESRWGLTARPRADFQKTQQAMLAEYRRLVGEVPTAAGPLRPRSELVLSAKKYRAYRVLLDLTGGIEVYGNLLVPEGIHGRAAAVVCQHGLSGTPEMITGIGQKEDTPYHEFGRRLAERGYVVFAPLILHYHPVELTNQQVRMADAVGMMRVALAVAQTRRVVDFLQSLPFVDPKRIGYYGLSYGGYSALWISPLEERLAAVVVSGHFNDWRSKITADTVATSYLLHPDEDFYNWDILHRFTHVELVAMDAPRPVCIEYGTRDGITTPEWTAYAWKQLAAVRDHLGLSGRIILAQFDGVHEVRGEESFGFVDRFLRAPH